MHLSTLLFLLCSTISLAQDTLYFKCQNILSIDTLQTKILSASGAEISMNEGKQTLIPFANQVVLKVQENNVVKVLRYPVKQITLPSLKLFSLGFDGAHSPKPQAPLHVNVRAVPDGKFVLQCPRDARYRATATKVEVWRKGILVDLFEGATTQLLKMKEVWPGDVVKIEVTMLERIN